MYVCICNAIRESTLREAATRCAGDAEAIYLSLGCTPQCGQCLPEANEIVESVRNARLLVDCAPS